MDAKKRPERPAQETVADVVARMRAEGLDVSNPDVVIGRLRANAREINTRNRPTILMKREERKAAKKSARRREKESRRQMHAIAQANLEAQRKAAGLLPSSAPGARFHLTSKKEREQQIIRDILAEQAWVTKLQARRERKGDSPEIGKAIAKASARVVELLLEAEDQGIVLPVPPAVAEALRQMKEAAR